MNMVHVEDVAAGVLLALDAGKPGESYVLGGQITTMRELIETVAKVADKKPPQARDPDRRDEGADARSARSSARSWVSRRTCAS